MKSIRFFLIQALLLQALSAASVSSSWNTFDGSWFTPGNWSHNPAQSTVPNNGADTFDVTVAITSGSPYFVSIGSSATVTKLTLKATNAIINQSSPATAVTVLDTFTLTSGSYHLNGGTFAPTLLNLNGGSLSFSGGTLAPCNVTLNGGTVVGGSLTTSGTGQLHLAANSSNILDGTTLVGGLLFDLDGGKLKLRNDASFAPSDATLGATSNTLIYEGTATDATASISSTLNLNGNGSSVTLFGLPIQLTVTPSGRIRGRGTVYANASNCELLNQGIISADLTGQSLSIETQTVTNASGGTLRALNGGTLTFNQFNAFNNLPGAILAASGGSTVTLQRNWHNSGNIVIADTSVLNLQGTCTTADLGLAGWLRSGGTVNLQAALDNTGTTLDLAVCGTLVLNGGSIRGGTILGNVFTLVLAFRAGAVFTQQPDGSQRNLAAVDSLHCSVQGSTTLGTFNQPVLHAGPAFAPPAGAGLPNLTGTGWEYHTFYLDPAVVSGCRFLRAVVDNQ